MSTRVRTATTLLAACALAAGCEEGERAVAHVGGTKISREQVEQLVEHTAEESKREGRPFPAKDTSGYHVYERRAVALLVRREQLEQAAAKLGVEVSDDDVERRLDAAGGEADAEGADKEAKVFFEGLLREQILVERVARRLSARVHVSAAELRAALARQPGRSRASLERELVSAKRNAALSAWTARAMRTVPVDYEPGWKP
jgi:hypothetical protein